MQATPVTWRLLLEAGWKGGKDFKALVGGEALPKDLADQLIARGVELWNMYGPTETTVWSTCTRITDTSNGITIGKPIANTTVYILDAQQQPLPDRGPGRDVHRRRWGHAGLLEPARADRRALHPGPVQPTPGATLYRTGDRARWRNDGTLEHLGRLDDQVKMRGYRIELGEIEAVLAEHPTVRQAAVHLWQVQANDVRIVACCVPANAGALAPVSLRKHLRARLPEYMIPQYFLPMEQIPLMPNGKVDRHRLPTPVVTESRIGQHEAPADPVETAIAEIWTKSDSVLLDQLAAPTGSSRWAAIHCWPSRRCDKSRPARREARLPRAFSGEPGGDRNKMWLQSAFSVAAPTTWKRLRRCDGCRGWVSHRESIKSRKLTARLCDARGAAHRSLEG